jgi:hypothetical protein
MMYIKIYLDFIWYIYFNHILKNDVLICVGKSIVTNARMAAEASNHIDEDGEVSTEIVAPGLTLRMPGGVSQHLIQELCAEIDANNELEQKLQENSHRVRELCEELKHHIDARCRELIVELYGDNLTDEQMEHLRQVLNIELA